MAKTGSWPDHQIRLFRSGTVEAAVLHAQPIVRGEVQYMHLKLLGIIHYNYDDLDDFIDRAQRYSRLCQRVYRNQSKQELGSQNDRCFFREYLTMVR